jgi:predicted ATPase
MLHQRRGEPQEALAQIEASLRLAHQQGFPFFVALGMVFQGAALVQQGHSEAGIQQLRQGIAAYKAIGTELILPFFLSLLAAAYGRSGRADVGLEVLEEALALVNTTGERLCEADLYRLKGEFFLQAEAQSLASRGDNPHAAEAEALFQQALTIARHQGARSWELRVAISLSRLWQQQGKHTAAYALLAPVYGWFTEGFDTADLQEARALLEVLG